MFLEEYENGLYFEIIKIFIISQFKTDKPVPRCQLCGGVFSCGSCIECGTYR